mmetsp:Transcript_24718/g.55877  ORF Transcript_24718/g.55877 Transcript_24718/m.55877 type:complete len:204 (+) Transcript_24718:174-785(+)
MHKIWWRSRSIVGFGIISLESRSDTARLGQVAVAANPSTKEVSWVLVIHITTSLFLLTVLLLCQELGIPVLPLHLVGRSVSHMVQPTMPLGRDQCWIVVHVDFLSVVHNPSVAQILILPVLIVPVPELVRPNQSSNLGLLALSELFPNISPPELLQGCEEASKYVGSQRLRLDRKVMNVWRLRKASGAKGHRTQRIASQSEHC